MAYSASQSSRAARSSKGFTLVELIVVIVIIGILAAIAVPALTGYIAKAEDSKWEMQGRDHYVAARSTLYSLDSQGKLIPPGGDPDYLIDGTAGFSGMKSYALDSFTPDRAAIKEISELIGKEEAYTQPGHFWFDIVGATDSSTTLWNADGFVYYCLPEGLANGSPAILVTYKVAPLSTAFSNSSQLQAAYKAGTYDANEGIIVYRTVKG